MTDGVFSLITMDPGIPPGPDSRAPRHPRHPRLPRFFGLDPRVDPSLVLGALRVAVIGCGAVGRYFALLLARLQPAVIWLVDHGHYKPSSLHTQAISPAEIGRPKASATGRVVKQIHAPAEVWVYDGAVEQLREDALAACHVVFLATDNLRAELETGRRCVQHSVPVLQGAVYGDALVAQVLFLHNGGPDSPCIACGFGESEWAHLSAETHWSCDGPVDGPATPRVKTSPTMSVAGLSSMAADLGAMVLIRHALKLGKPVGDCRVEYCAYTQQIVTSPLARNPQCPAEHGPWDRKSIEGPLADASLRQVATAAGCDRRTMSHGALSFMVDQFSFAPEGICDCADPGAINRFVLPGRPGPVCGTCNSPLTPVRTSRRVPMSVVAAFLDQPLGQLGAAGAVFAVVRDDGRAAFVTGSTHTAEVKNES